MEQFPTQSWRARENQLLSKLQASSKAESCEVSSADHDEMHFVQIANVLIGLSLPGLLARHRWRWLQKCGLLSLLRRHHHNLRAEQQLRLAAYLAQHPLLETIYRFKQRLCYLLLKKHRTRKQCEQLVPRFLRAVYQLRQAGLAPLAQLGQTLSAWSEEIVAMWRLTRNNGITEGFHNKMELINRQAYGFRNFENYRMRVQVLCA